MSLYIIISQGARIASVWVKRKYTKQILLSISILAYSALIMEREKKIKRYYDRRRNNFNERSGRGDEDDT